MAKLAQLLSLVSGRSTDVKSDTESDILPADYERGDQPSTPQAQTSVAASDADSPSVRVLQPEEAAGLEVVRKKCRPKCFDDFTDPTKKIKLDKQGLVAEPLRKCDPQQEKSFHKWIIGKIDNKRDRNVYTGTHSVAWFLQLHTVQTWLWDSHIDVALHMLRRRCHFYHAAFRQDAAIMNTTFPQVCLGRWNHFRETDTKYTWDDDVLRMLKGDDNQFLISWQNVSEVYFALHVEKTAHWIAIEVSIPTWCINIYDSNHSVLSPTLMEEAIKPWCLLLPLLLWCSGMFDDHEDLQVYPEQNAKPFSYCRIPPEECPQTKTRIDQS
ncbi:uncharacterized protein LOC133779841 [Humulus lupulus]|uniref:uncharacterized protein LOC133779841 n=1 Tax=Humulus lupulus TaxID=3486 RepID=UPI002B41103C|nr:uncharacterized protein LOC133779841 [Humulus lupulus]